MTKKQLWWGLVVSFGLNVFLVVFLAVDVLRGPPPPPSVERIIERMLSELPAEDARILRKAADDEQARSGGLTDGPWDDPERLRRILLSDPFDLQAFLDVSNEGRKHFNHHNDTLQRILADALPRLSVEGRRGLAKSMPPPRRR